MILVAIGISLATTNLLASVISLNPSLVWHLAQYFPFLALVVPVKCFDNMYWDSIAVITDVAWQVKQELLASFPFAPFVPFDPVSPTGPSFTHDWAITRIKETKSKSLLKFLNFIELSVIRLLLE